jgi:hypothetical protein
MPNWLPSLLGALVKPLSILFGVLFIKRQGAKEAELKGKKEALNEAKKAEKDRNEVRNLDDDALANIVFFKRKKPDDK